MAVTVDILDKLKMAREMLGLSQQEVANIFSVDQKSISHWENGINLPSLEHQGKIVAWLKEAGKQLNTPPNPTPGKVTAFKGSVCRTPPALKQQVLERLEMGQTRRQIAAELHVGAHTITKIRHEAHIPVKSQHSKQAEHIEEAWNIARNETRTLDPTKLSDADKVSFAMALEDIRAWLAHYIKTNLADALDPKKIREEIKRVLK